jgi:hypothetical protein
MEEQTVFLKRIQIFLPYFQDTKLHLQRQHDRLFSISRQTKPDPFLTPKPLKKAALKL